jgi:hypothetical protein
METKYYFLLIGIAIGWITKVPFLIKWYKELKRYKEGKVKLYNRLINEVNKLPKDEQSKFWITIAYFRDGK